MDNLSSSVNLLFIPFFFKVLNNFMFLVFSLSINFLFGNLLLLELFSLGNTYTKFHPYMDLNRFLASFPKLQEFLYVGIFDHDFHHTLITWSNHPPRNQIPNFPENIAHIKNAHISHIVLLPYNTCDMMMAQSMMGILNAIKVGMQVSRI